MWIHLRQRSHCMRYGSAESPSLGGSGSMGGRVLLVLMVCQRGIAGISGCGRWECLCLGLLLQRGRGR